MRGIDGLSHEWLPWLEQEKEKAHMLVRFGGHKGQAMSGTGSHIFTGLNPIKSHKGTLVRVNDTQHFSRRMIKPPHLQPPGPKLKEYDMQRILSSALSDLNRALDSVFSRADAGTTISEGIKQQQSSPAIQSRAENKGGLLAQFLAWLGAGSPARTAMPKLRATEPKLRNTNSVVSSVAGSSHGKLKNITADMYIGNEKGIEELDTKQRLNSFSSAELPEAGNYQRAWSYQSFYRELFEYIPLEAKTCALQLFKKNEKEPLSPEHVSGLVAAINTFKNLRSSSKPDTPFHFFVVDSKPEVADQLQTAFSDPKNRNVIQPGHATEG
jgi:hypothetical protein